MSEPDGPIGVFDSGVGGLTVLKALRTALPADDFIYLGDTARLPYGTKSPQSVLRYSLQCAEALVSRGIRCLVVACNTASASALPDLRRRYAAIPVIGVIEPGAAAAVAASHSRHIAVIGTEGTIGGGAYQSAIHRLDARVRVTGRACSLFVALAEEGWTDGHIAAAVARRYLEPIFSLGAPGTDGDNVAVSHGPAPQPIRGGSHRATDTPAGTPDTLVLGCTHFPVLTGVIRAVLPPHVRIVDSAQTVAAALVRTLRPAPRAAARGRIQWLATDGAARFARVSGIFLGDRLRAADIEIIDL